MFGCKTKCRAFAVPNECTKIIYIRGQGKEEEEEEEREQQQEEEAKNMAEQIKTTLRK